MEDVTSIVRIQRAVEYAHVMTDIELIIILIVWVSKFICMQSGACQCSKLLSHYFQISTNQLAVLLTEC